MLRPEPLDRVCCEDGRGAAVELGAESLGSSRSPSQLPTPSTSPAHSPGPRRALHLQPGTVQDPKTEQVELRELRPGPRPAHNNTNTHPHPHPHADPELAVQVDVHERKLVDKRELEVANVAYMIIFGNAANNFVDGMSVGAAFSDSVVRGASIGLAVASQQFPQELGTLAILVNSGLGLRRTLWFQASREPLNIIIVQCWPHL